MRKPIVDLFAEPSDLYPSQQSLTVVERTPVIPGGATPELLEGLPDSDCARILSSGQRSEVPAGDVIFRAGDRKRIFLLLEGCVKVSQVTKDGREVILWINSPGQTIGSLDLASRTQSSRAKALQMCKVIVWDLPTFEENIDRFPRFFRNVMAIGARQTNDLSRRIREVSTEEAMPRLAHELVRLAEQIGRRVNGYFEISLTQEDLAQMIAMNLYCLNRQLSEWERQQLVTRRRNTIVIRDLQGLKRVGCMIT